MIGMGYCYSGGSELVKGKMNTFRIDRPPVEYVGTIA